MVTSSILTRAKKKSELTGRWARQVNLDQTRLKGLDG
jgi:hypothetical protein